MRLGTTLRLSTLAGTVHSDSRRGLACGLVRGTVRTVTPLLADAMAMASCTWAFAGVPRTVRVSGFPLMQRGFNGDYDLVLDEASALAPPEPEEPTSAVRVPTATCC